MKLRTSLRELGILVTGICAGMGIMKMEGCANDVRQRIQRLFKEEAPTLPIKKPERYRRSTAFSDTDTHRNIN